jgi:uncharacterized protein DUF3185
MGKILSLLSLIAGIWLIYLGYERQLSLAGKADRTLSKIGTAIDGGDHTPTHVKYYVAGTALSIAGVLGLGIIKR